MAKRITEQDFETIKQAKKDGVPTKWIAKSMGYSKGTISNLVHFDSLDDYKRFHRARLAKYKNEANNNSVKEPKQPKEAYKMPELERIAVALENLVEAWNTTKESGKKKGWLK